jgi:hypothetical protein
MKWLCLIGAFVLILGPGLGSEREAAFWMIGGCLLFLIGYICVWIDSRRKRKSNHDAP